MAANILICGANWLGDTVMSMPAVQMFKRDRPSSRITVLVKSALAPLWRMHAAVDHVLELRFGLFGTNRVVRVTKSRAFDQAFVFPNSFRSALIPFLARVPGRTGMQGHQRAQMLNLVVTSTARPGRMHQLWEYIDIMGLPGQPNPPELSIPRETTEQARELAGNITAGRCIAILPGAARGPSKRWPTGHFIDVGRKITGAYDRRILVLGSEQETAACLEIADGIGEQAVSLAGRTSLPQLAALLEMCDVVITNDSGGMHLAAAVGTRVVAIFGMTDPARTGPIGQGHQVILTEQDQPRSRDIERDSAAAREILRSITPGRVFEATTKVLEETG